MSAWTLPDTIADWVTLLSSALDARSRRYLRSIMLGLLLASGRRTVSCWLRAAGVSDDWQDHYYFLETLGRSAHSCGHTGDVSGSQADPGQSCWTVCEAGSGRFADERVRTPRGVSRHAPQSDAGTIRCGISLRSCVGDDQLAGATSPVGSHWSAAAARCCTCGRKTFRSGRASGVLRGRFARNSFWRRNWSNGASNSSETGSTGPSW